MLSVWPSPINARGCAGWLRTQARSPIVPLQILVPLRGEPPRSNVLLGEDRASLPALG